jgi:arylsulfatase A-like enzyme
MPRSCCSRGLRLFAALALALGCSDAVAPRHVVLVTIDTLRADHVAPYGDILATPAFARLAEEGVVVERAVTSIPTTGPALASLLTGSYPWHHGVLNNAVALDEDTPTLPRLLREHGVETAGFVSTYVLHPRFGFDQGFDHYAFIATEPMKWSGKNHQRFFARGEKTVEAAFEWLDARDAPNGERLFLWIHLFDPHAPHDPPEAFRLAPDAPISLEGLAVPRLRSGKGKEMLEGVIRSYRGEVQYVDAQLAALLDGFDARALGDDTLFIVTADHGEAFGENRFYGHSDALYEPIVQIPLVFRGPGIPAGRRLNGTAQLEDLFATILHTLDVPAPEGIDGVDLSGWISGERDASPRTASLGRQRRRNDTPERYYYETGGRKWIGHLDQPGAAFDLTSDPREIQSSAAPAPARLLAALAGAEPGAPVPDPEALEPEARDALEALGYLDAPVEE